MTDKFEKEIREEIHSFLHGNQFALKQVGINLKDEQKPTLNLELYVMDKDEELEILDSHEILDNFTNVEFEEVEEFVVNSILGGVRDELNKSEGEDTNE